MKIAMIGHKRIPGREGGIEVVVEELATRLVKKDCDVTVFNRKSKKKNKNFIKKKYNGVKIVNVPTLEKKNTDAIIASFIASIIAVFKKFDVIHYHGIGPSIMAIIPYIFRKKIVVTVHGLNYKTPKWGKVGTFFMKLGEKITVKCANKIIVLSKNQQKYFEDRYNRKTEYIPNGTNISFTNQSNIIEKKWRLKKDEYILFVSRIVPGKGLEYLINAFENIDTNLKLVIAGESTFADDFYNLIKDKAAIDNRIKMIGFVKEYELAELYSNTRLFVFPSEAEGMPIALLEAISCNAPCLVSNIEENMEIGRKRVTSFKSGDEDDLREKIKNIISKPKVNYNNLEYVSQNFNWDVIADKTKRIYED